MDAASAVFLPVHPRVSSAWRCQSGGFSGPQLLRTPFRMLPCADPFASNRRSCNLYYRRGAPHRRHEKRKLLCSQVKLEDDAVDDEACELVSGVELVIGEGKDSVRAYLMKAVKNNNGTGLLLLSDALGFEDSATRDFAYQVACHGYNVLVPDLFRGNAWKKSHPIDEFENWLSKQVPERVARDIDACTKWMIDEFMAAGISKKLGILGFSFGGGHLIEALSRDEQAYFGTGVCYYGTNVDPSKGSNIRVPVLFVCGDNDPLCSVSTLHQLEKNIQSSRVVIYPGRGHGFVHRPESEEEDQDAEDACAITRNWVHDKLITTSN